MKPGKYINPTIIPAKAGIRSVLLDSGPKTAGMTMTGVRDGFHGVVWSRVMTVRRKDVSQGSTDRFPALIAILLLAVLSLLPCGCQPEKPLAGTYRSPQASDGAPPAELKLEADGKGVWRVGKETVSFKWESRGPEIWLHTKTGGVVRGTVESDHSLDIQVPGVGPFHFKKTE
ncbi:MAG: hypothetical protein AB9873_15670 [Syntrophobacteraceae bacterium]